MSDHPSGAEHFRLGHQTFVSNPFEEVQRVADGDPIAQGEGRRGEIARRIEKKPKDPAMNAPMRLHDRPGKGDDDPGTARTNLRDLHPHRPRDGGGIPQNTQSLQSLRITRVHGSMPHRRMHTPGRRHARTSPGIDGSSSARASKRTQAMPSRRPPRRMRSGPSGSSPMERAAFPGPSPAAPATPPAADSLKQAQSTESTPSSARAGGISAPARGCARSHFKKGSLMWTSKKRAWGSSSAKDI